MYLALFLALMLGILTSIANPFVSLEGVIAMVILGLFGSIKITELLKEDRY